MLNLKFEQRRLGHPLFLNSVPKCGSHLLRNIVRMTAELGRVATFFGFNADAAKLDAIARGPLMMRYSKDPDYEYSPNLREQLIAQEVRLQGADIDAALAMFAELLALIEMLLIDGPLAAGALVAALAALPAIVETEPEGSRPAVLAVTCTAIPLWLAALLMPRASTERPLQFSIDYFRDAAKQKANWAVATKQAPLPRNYPGQWNKKVLPYNGRTRWVADAPLLDTPVPTAKVMSAQPSGAGRKVLLSLSSGGANTIAIRFPKNAKLLALGLAGSPVVLPPKGEPDKPILRCTGRACEGLQIEAVLGDNRPIDAELFSTKFGLPPQGQPLTAARPKNAIPQYAPDSTITMSRIRL